MSYTCWYIHKSSTRHFDDTWYNTRDNESSWSSLMQKIENQKFLWVYVTFWRPFSLISSTRCHATYGQSSMNTLLDKRQQLRNGPQYACTSKISSTRWSSCATSVQTIEHRYDSTAMSDIVLLGVRPVHIASVEMPANWALLKLYHVLTEVKHFFKRPFTGALLSNNTWIFKHTMQKHQIPSRVILPKDCWKYAFYSWKASSNASGLKPSFALDWKTLDLYLEILLLNYKRRL